MALVPYQQHLMPFDGGDNWNNSSAEFMYEERISYIMVVHRTIAVYVHQYESDDDDIDDFDNTRNVPLMIVEENEDTSTSQPLVNADTEVETTSTTHGMLSWFEERQNYTTLRNGTVIASKLIIGQIIGISAACLLKKFRKLTLTGITALVIFELTQLQGYKLIDWSQIYKEVGSNLEEEEEEDDDKLVGTNGSKDWVLNKFKTFKTCWTKNNAAICIGAGFVCGFMYKSLR